MIFECGVLSAEELRAALSAAFSARPVRRTRHSYYLWLTLGKAENEIATETRRLFLTPAAAALILSIEPEQGTPPSVKAAFRAICRRIGLDGKAPSLTALMSGVAVQMRFAGDIPQFVVDYAQRLLHSHAPTEMTWRRLLGLAPWKVDITPSTLKDAVEENEEDEAPAAIPSVRSDGGLYSEIGRTLATAQNPSELIAGLSKLDALKSHSTHVEQLLFDWVTLLSREISGTGKPRRAGTIRGMLSALGPRLIASVGDGDVGAVSADEWRAIVEQVADEKLSASRRTAINNALHHFLHWMVSKGLIAELPVDVPTFGPGSGVNATLVGPSEFRELLRLLDDDLSSEPEPDRIFQKLVALLGYDGSLRRGESVGLLSAEVSAHSQAFVDVVHNSMRILKTDSSARRIPLGLQVKGATEPAVSSALRSPSCDGRLLPFDGISVDHETLLRKLSRKLSEICGDPDVSIHSLRHSAATWILLCLYADALQLGRFRDQWPFVDDLLAIASDVRRILFGNKSSLHGLHIVRQLLGHRHESMSLQHYIHALDLMRHAAATLRNGDEDLESVICSAQIVRPRMTRSDDVGAFLQKLQRRYPKRILFDDTPRTLSAPGSEPLVHDDAEPLKRWLALSASCAAGSATLPAEIVKWHKSVVDLINDRHAVNRAKNLGGMSSLDDIRPADRTDTWVAASISAWVAGQKGANPMLEQTAREVIESHTMRGLGWFGLEIRSYAARLELLNNLADLSGARVELAIEKKKRKGLGKARRTFDSVPTIEAAQTLKRRTVFARLEPMDGSSTAAACSHSTLIWCLAMATTQAN